MPYEFTPAEQFQHVMWVLDQLQDRYHDSDSDLKPLWAKAISTHLGFLVEMVCDLNPKIVAEDAT